MELRFIGQPFPGSEQAGAVILDALADHGARSAWFATAWAKHSGLSRMADAIKEFRDRGGYAEAVVGVDEGGATKEGLALALQTFDAAFVFHDPGPRTFHPKVYVVEQASKAVAIVGSGNLTRGGMYTNYEAAFVAELDTTKAADAAVLAQIRAYYDQLVAMPDACKPLTAALMTELESDPGVILVSERQTNRRRAQQRAGGGSTLFGQSVGGLLGAPPPGASALAEEDQDDDDVAPQQVGRAPGTGTPVGVAELRWWKRLTRSDVGRKGNPNSNQRNGVVLSQAGHTIPWQTWFREELFGDLTWTAEQTRTGKAVERTLVPFEVFIDGTYTGRYDVRVNHSVSRISNQGNSPTYLNWSSLLDLVKADDYTGWWLELARLPDGSHRLQVLRDEPSP